MNVGNDGVFVRNVMMDIRIGYMRVGLKFCLRESWRWSYRSDKAHAKDTKDPLELQPPGSDCFIVALLVEAPKDRISVIPLDDVPLNLDHSAAIGTL